MTRHCVENSVTKVILVALVVATPYYLSELYSIESVTILEQSLRFLEIIVVSHKICFDAIYDFL